MTAHVEANSARRRGQAFAAASGDPSHTISEEDSEEYDKEHAKDFAAFVAFKNAAKAKAKPSTSSKPKSKPYCWTHGARGHASGGDVKPCLNPAPGHKFEATFENQMGGRAAK